MTTASTAPDLSAIVKAYDVRGVVPDQWDERTARALGAAVADVLVLEAGHPAGGSPDTGTGAGAARRLVVGHDMRPSSPGLVEAFAAGAQDRGVDVVVVGLCSTDGLYYASGVMDAPGAMFTASHNPAQYNGIKLCRAGARPVSLETGLAAVRDHAAASLAGDGVGVVDDRGARTDEDVLRGYGEHLRGLVDLSGSRPLRVVVDAGNGMAGLTVPAVLEEAAGLPALPLDVRPLYFELDGTFPNHEANPLEPANLVDLQRAVVEQGADIGLAFDGDADRCFVVDERGEAVSPSAVTALVALREIARERAADPDAPVTVIHNLITSQVVPELVTGAGATAVRTRVGHSFIKEQMATTGAVFGGEHSAHYYFAAFWGADTGMLAAMHVLAALGATDQPLSELVADYAPYAASGEINSTVHDVPAAVERVRQVFAARGAGFDELDGMTVTAPVGDGDEADGPAPGAGPGGRAWWFNLRASNTEPLLRLNVEAVDAATLAAVRDEVLALVRADA
ncbi:phosphomannomutase/phosphoglucomutase [Pseudokineococcus lusitanus]|uniref:Phosphomannomutase n=1 Tax=Pseudokineococcus lusitanus TaxID=763993 RepID=A0A3N1G8Z9_9ACTN|nr:phosphomannomutase/phosphoglucomutase [Pseudokineococcus lusitanus]ROP26729.1 phosphomannomutase [Pseudokineococcus lusitanus]